MTEFLVYMRDYVEEALHYVTRNPDPEANKMALENVRKVAALGVSCMEQHGAPHRYIPRPDLSPAPWHSPEDGW